VTPREVVGDGSGLEITLERNGRRVQHGNTSQMLHATADLVAFVSSWMTLERGDLLFTGTPAGVGPIAPGDSLTARIERVGEISVAFDAAD
jgi:2-keto-4-pentenoate hydratase/2-oxohepta-3-ene-1,7-dioic acid hydratase in catechol pathway